MFDGDKVTEDIILAENAEYQLRFLKADDKDDYMRVVVQNSNISKAYEEKDFYEYTWKVAAADDEWILMILEKKTGAICGYCNIRKNGSDTLPELGIDILPEYQAKGIGGQALKMLMEACKREKSINSFIARVDSRNIHSQHLMKKLGAVQIGTEASEMGEILDKNPDLGNIEEAKELYQMLCSMADESFIIAYRLEC